MGIALLFFPILFGVYLITACPVVYLGDSGEFTAAAFSLGVPHNSGYPLYGLIGKVFCMIPFGNVGFRMNLMSVFFAVLTVGIVYSIIKRMTSSILSSFIGAFSLAFAPLFWSQTGSAEVYPLHTFFVALLIWLLWEWHERKAFHLLVLFAFVTGISLGNHLQTVMLAPAVLFMILSAEPKSLLKIRRLATLSAFFFMALTLYLYLPIRTDAGAAVHWGDPNNLERFMAHVTATSHRHGYVFNKTTGEYLHRSYEALKLIWAQFGVFLLFSLLGWVRLSSHRWRIFFAATILFDLIYTVFLNTISLEITPFTLPTSLVLAILMGFGLHSAIRSMVAITGVHTNTVKGIKIVACLFPVVPLVLNFGRCDQSRNYTAYEHALNIGRSLHYGGTLFLDGDNHIFPVVYGRIVEGMCEGIRLYDKSNIFFKMPPPPEGPYDRSDKNWEEVRAEMERRIVEKWASKGVFFAVFNPFTISLPDNHSLIPYGILNKVVGPGTDSGKNRAEPIWGYYSTVSFYGDFERDFMNRQVCAYFFFYRGKYFFAKNQAAFGFRNFQLASEIGYDDTTIHSDLAVFLSDRGYFEKAEREMEKASLYYEDPGGLHNNWGYYYFKKGDYQKAIAFFEKAIQLRPNEYGYYNNLAFTFLKLGKKEHALYSFQKSLAIKGDQPRIRRLLADQGMTEETEPKDDKASRGNGHSHTYFNGEGLK